MSRATAAAEKLLAECGIVDPLEIPIEIIVRSKNIILKEDDIEGADGRILIKGDSAVITINSNIDFYQKKRFAIAHELGHFLLHRGQNKLYNDNERSLNQWYHTNFVSEEMEANEFAAELLMPSELFHEDCKGKVFEPMVIDSLADRFMVSKTAAIMKFVKAGNYPVCVVYCSDKKMRWWKTSNDFKYLFKFEYDQSPPSGSVADELFTTGNSYFNNDRKQKIWKSTWFELHDAEQDKIMYEFCLYAISYNYTLSVIWED
jgi:Zn-dependent peptidase ImmA (M78 family)